jgi:hypothetical protein
LVKQQAADAASVVQTKGSQTAAFDFRSLAIASQRMAVLVLEEAPASWQIHEAKNKLAIF